MSRETLLPPQKTTTPNVMHVARAEEDGKTREPSSTLLRKASENPGTLMTVPGRESSVARENCLSVKSQEPPETGNSAERSTRKVSCPKAKNLKQTRTRPGVCRQAPPLKHPDVQTTSETATICRSSTRRSQISCRQTETAKNLAKLRTEREAPNRAQMKTDKDTLVHAILLTAMGHSGSTEMNGQRRSEPSANVATMTKRKLLRCRKDTQPAKEGRSLRSPARASGDDHGGQGSAGA